MPLLLSLHGAGGNGGVQETDTGWSGFADTHSLIVAYPDGWWNLLPNNGWWESQKKEPNNKDITFVRQLVATISSTYCIDPNRIFVDGFSLGGGMSQRMACEADDLIAAVTAVGAIDPTEPLGNPGTPDGTYLRYTPCNAGAEIFWRTWPDQAHQFPQGARGTAARTLIWSFFMAHPKP